MPKSPYNLVVETYEEGRAAPVLTHTFHGDTPDQAAGFYRAHLKSDAFLRQCGQQQRFGNFSCHNKIVGLFNARGRKIS